MKLTPMSTRTTRTIWLIAFSFWTYFALLSAIETGIEMYTHHHSMLRVTAYELSIWWMWVAFLPVIIFMVRRLPLIPITPAAIAAHTFVAIILGAIHGFFWIWFSVVIQPYDVRGLTAMPHATPVIMLNRITGEILIYAGMAGIAQLVPMYAQWREREARAAQLEASLAQARLYALELQMQPHFFFNTLHAISGLVRANRNEDAVEMIAGLSDLLRYSLEHESEQRVPLDRELSILTRYLDIQKMRFSDRLDVDMNIDDDTRRALVPTLLLQPLAENAIRHGIARSASAGKLTITAARLNGDLRIEMFNTGTLVDPKKRGIGLRNTEERLRQMYGEQHSFELRNDRGGVVAVITLPWSERA